jgi:hypothetical protein
MKPAEAMHVLAVAAAYDNRPPSQATATTWAYDLADIKQAEAIDAVREHYRDHPDTWIKPGHVIAIVKRARSLGLANSSRVEIAAIERLDRDDPDFDAKYQRAIQDARRAAGDDPRVIPPRIAIGGPGRGTPDVAERARRGNARATAELEKRPRASEPKIDPNVPENLQRAREVARQYKRERARRPPESQPTPLAGVVGRTPEALVNQFQKLPERQEHDQSHR